MFSGRWCGVGHLEQLRLLSIWFVPGGVLSLSVIQKIMIILKIIILLITMITIFCIIHGLEFDKELDTPNLLVTKAHYNKE